MRIVIAPDSFKECLSAHAVAAAIAAGWRSARPGDHLDLVPIADGGEGTVDAMLAATGGRRITASVTGPLGTPVDALYGLLDDDTAIIEMAAASGLALVPEGQRDPSRATSRGTGELLLHATAGGAKHIFLGIGGSATNDAGAGLLQALGYRLLDITGADLPPGGAALARMARILSPVGLSLPPITVACDVNNPLTGPNGASHIYGPQKGASRAQVLELDHALGRFATLAALHIGKEHRNTPGAGAAGGLGFALIAFLRAVLRPGIEIVAETTGLEAKIAGADLVITGEGRVDAQSAMGKAVGGVLALAQRHARPAIVLAGTLGPGHEALPAEVVPIAPPGTPLAEGIARAADFLHATAARLAERASP